MLRTAAGISNEHLFHRSESVVYVEGGGAQQSPPFSSSVDLLHWRGLFEKFLGGRRFHFKPQGGKPTLLAIAKKVADGTVSGTIVCMDRDHDHLGSFHASVLVLYTYGYSWENDVWSALVIERLFYVLCGVDKNSVDAKAEAAARLASFAAKLAWVVRADVLGAQHGQSVIPRGTLKCVSSSNKGWPDVDRAYLKSCVRAARAATAGVKVALPYGISVTPLRDVYGHVLGHFCYRLLSELLHRACKARISKEQASSLAIEMGRSLMSAEVESHYRELFQHI